MMAVNRMREAGSTHEAHDANIAADTAKLQQELKSRKEQAEDVSHVRLNTLLIVSSGTRQHAHVRSERRIRSDLSM